MAYTIPVETCFFSLGVAVIKQGVIPALTSRQEPLGHYTIRTVGKNSSTFGGTSLTVR